MFHNLSKQDRGLSRAAFHLLNPVAARSIASSMNEGASCIWQKWHSSCVIFVHPAPLQQGSPCRIQLPFREEYLHLQSHVKVHYTAVLLCNVSVMHYTLHNWEEIHLIIFIGIFLVPNIEKARYLSIYNKRIQNNQLIPQ